MMISKKLRDAVKTSDLKGYLIARKARVNPSALSGIINNTFEVKPTDPRVKRIAKVLGLPLEECFEPNPEEDEERAA